MPFFNVPRVDYDVLLDTLKYPLVWSYDSLLSGFIPGEVDWAFIKWLQGCPTDFQPSELPPGRLRQLEAAGLLDSPERKTGDQLQAEMNALGCVRIPQLLHGEYTRSLAASYYWRNSHLIERHRDMKGIKRTSVNNLPLMRLLHQLTEGLVQSITPIPVKTSYSFTSAYEAGTTLPAHTDRSQCVYNISLMLASQPGRAKLSAWPLHIQHGDVIHHIALEAGDGVLYSGTQDEHWRDALPAHITSVLGVFLHYVPQDFDGSLD